MTKSLNLARRLSAHARRHATAGEMGEAISHAIAPVVAHDALRMVGTSPTSGVGSFSFWHGVEPGLGRPWLLNYLAGAEPFPMERLARSPIPAGVMGSGGDRPFHPARQLLATHGVGGQLRLLLRDARGIWGSLDLLRGQDRPPFDERDVRRAAHLTPALLAAIRGYVRAGPLAPRSTPPAPGVLIVGGDDVIRTATPEAHTWMDALRERQPNPSWTSEPFMAGLAIKARAHARASHTPRPLSIGPSAGYGHWIVCQAAPLDDGSKDVAIIIQAASGEHLLTCFSDWYELAPRERQVLAHLRDGLSRKQIAHRLDLSMHTISDYLKAIHRKTGATGRDELLAALIP
ncbi:response regulator transcription factor [Nonomuraea sp. NPDC050394]|uniref:response regulator transcription factor n=1 Tax=Nonomuraea sp. NPDC050394 TaxID=3364363 RepID=UPI0037A53D55